MSNSLWPRNCSPPGSSVQGDSPGKNSEVCCPAPCQGVVLPNLGIKPRSPTVQADSLPIATRETRDTHRGSSIAWVLCVPLCLSTWHDFITVLKLLKWEALYKTSYLMPNDDYCFLAQVGYLPETYILGLFANYLNDYINNIYILSHWKGGFKYLTDFYLDTVHCIFVNCKSNIPMRKKHTVFLENWNTKNWKQEHHKLRHSFT